MTEQEQDDDIRNCHAETMATQLLLTGLMRGLMERGFPRHIVEEIFDNAADLAISVSYRFGAADQGQSARTLDVIEQLRKSAISG